MNKIYKDPNTKFNQCPGKIFLGSTNSAVPLIGPAEPDVVYPQKSREHPTKPEHQGAVISRLDDRGDHRGIGSLHLRLRAATRHDHERLDRAMDRLDLAEIGDYRILLATHQLAIEGLRPEWRPVDRPDFDGMLRCVRDDLAAIGAESDRISSATGPSGCSYHGLGVAYVIRGSRLGARLLRKRVPAAFPASFLGFEPGLAWPAFLRQLDGVAGAGPDVEDGVLRGAKAAFAVFAAVAGHCGVLRE